MISCAISRLVIVCFGTLYPAYASYKAVRTKNVKEYVKWMMYWIVFALFTCVETFTDVILSFWFPFYYEIKIVLVLWLLSPATKGSSYLYRKFVHPQLVKREKDIDEYLIRAKQEGYHAVLQLGSKGINYASQVLVQTALKGGGQFVNHLQRSYSLNNVFAGNELEDRRFQHPHFLREDDADQTDTAAEEDSLPLDDFSDGQNFPSIGKYQSDKEASTSSLRHGVANDDVNRSNAIVDDMNCDVPMINDLNSNRSSVRLRLKRAKSNSSSVNLQDSAFEERSRATLPRTNKRSTGRRKKIMPIT